MRDGYLDEDGDFEGAWKAGMEGTRGGREGEREDERGGDGIAPAPGGKYILELCSAVRASKSTSPMSVCLVGLVVPSAALLRSESASRCTAVARLGVYSSFSSKRLPILLAHIVDVCDARRRVNGVQIS